MELPKQEEVNGIFAISKPKGITSQDAVAKLKFLFAKTFGPLEKPPKNQRRTRRQKQAFKIGHGGTLDPLAEGVLVIGVGNGTKKLAHYLNDGTKQYTAIALLGAKTTTYDSEGSVLEYGNVEGVTNDDVKRIAEKFTGEIKQLPPVFSALKVDGKPLYQYARDQEPLPRKIEMRDCKVDYLNLGELKSSVDLPSNVSTESERQFAESVIDRKLDPIPEDIPKQGASLDMSFSVSSGTYIRSLINDIGEGLGCKAHMTSLIRDSQGEWELGKNVIPLKFFDEQVEKWWPLMQTALEEGPKRELDLDLEVEPKKDQKEKKEQE